MVDDGRRRALAALGLALAAVLIGDRPSPAQVPVDPGADVAAIVTRARAQARPAGRPLVIGHRGSGAGSEPEPENTLMGIKKGFAEGADAVEFDVQLSKDGVVMLLHDVAVNRLTRSNKGCIADFTKEQLQKMALVDGRGRASPERFAALEDVLAFLKSRPAPDAGGLRAVIHIKSYDGLFGDMPENASGFFSTLACPKTDYAALVEKTMALADAAGLGDEVLFASTDRRVLAAVHSRRASAKVALISSDPRDALAAASRLKYDAVLLKYQDTSRAELQSAKARGLKAYVWAPDTVHEMIPDVDWVDGIIANSVPAALAARAEAGNR